jgi:hypothetical protein
MSAARTLLALLLPLCALSCTEAAPSQPAQAVTASTVHWEAALLDDPPHVRQRPDFCGEACVEMALRGLGHEVDQDLVFSLTGLDPALGRGAWTADLKRAVEALGFDPGPVWTSYDHKPTTVELDEAFGALHADLLAGVPSIVCMHYDARPATTEHFRLVLGYDPATDELLYHEPAEDDGAFRRMDRGLFYELWPLRGRETWTTIRLRMDPGDLRLPTPAGSHSAADYAQAVQTLRRTQLPEGFTVVVEPPFVVVGDEDPKVVKTRAARTVRTYSRALERDYFARQPDEIYTIWLFGDAASYEGWALKLWGESPGTPYGYASDHHRALVMNIATGGGTLVHEIVHAYIATDFPDCPPWLNEGLASLYEHVSIRDGHIHGHTNWRLAGLKTAIELDAVPSFRWLSQASAREFYGEDSGTHYAQARYLCQYLQEKGLIREFYRQVRDNAGRDPGGYDTLERMLDIDDQAAFFEEWKAWVMALEES